MFWFLVFCFSFRDDFWRLFLGKVSAQRHPQPERHNWRSRDGKWKDFGLCHSDHPEHSRGQVDGKRRNDAVFARLNSDSYPRTRLADSRPHQKHHEIRQDYHVSNRRWNVQSMPQIY